MVVINKKENLNKSILHLRLTKIPATFKTLLDILSAEGKNMGVKRNNYYLFNLDSVFHITRANAIDKTYRIFRWIIQKSEKSGFTDVMFILP